MRTSCRLRRLLLVLLILLGVTIAAATTARLFAQARSAPDWTTQGFDAQRSSWVRVDPFISLKGLEKFQFLWKLKVDNETRHGNALTSPVALGNLMTFRGFKSLVFVGGSSNNVYAIDYDFGTLFWKTHHNYAAGAREYAGSATCPGGMTVPLTRATSLTPATQLAFFGFARPPRPAKGDVGEPGKGAPQLAEIAARQAARNAGRGSDTPAPARGAQPPAKSPPPNFVFSVAADGLLRGLIPDTGDLALAPARFLPPNSTATGLIWADGVVYAATSNTCGSAPTGVFAMDFLAENKPVTIWQTNGAGIAGLSLGVDGTVYTSVGSGSTQYANSVVALDGKALQVRDWYTTANGPFISAPVVFVEGDRSFVAVTTAAGLYLLDGRSLGGADHRTPLSQPEPAANNAWRPEGVATWRDSTGTRWVLGVASDSIAAFKMIETAGRVALQPAWTSIKLVRPRTPIIVNDALFVLSGGDESSNAVLYALDPVSGRELWNSGTAITSFASGGLSAGTGQVHVITADNTVWAFGIPLAIN